MGMRSLASACGGLGSPGKNGAWAELSPLMRSVILPHSATRLQRNGLGRHVGGEMGRMDSSRRRNVGLATPLGPETKGSLPLCIRRSFLWASADLWSRQHKVGRTGPVCPTSYGFYRHSSQTVIFIELLSYPGSLCSRGSCSTFSV